MLVVLIAASPVWVGLLQLLPIGSSFWTSLPGREPYFPALTAAGVSIPHSLPLSLHPSATWAALWSAVPVGAVFVAALFIDQHRTEKLLQLLLLAALFQSLLGLLQFTQGSKSPLYFESAFGGVIGSFNNRNHLANFLAMLVPVWFYFLIRQQTPKKKRRHSHTGTGRLQFASKPLWLFGGFGMLTMVLSTRSRGGLIAVTSVLLISILFYLFSLGSKLTRMQKLGVLVAFVVFAVSSLFAVEIDTLGQRFDGLQLKTDSELRNAYALATLDAARTFWPWGSGMGSFEAVFPRFQPLHTPGYVPHAHNDYPQLLMELGAAAVLIVTMVCALVVLQVYSLWRALKRARRMTAEVALRSFAGLGALALLLHSWVEFNMHIPALAITAAFLAGVFLKPLAGQEASRHREGLRSTNPMGQAAHNPN